MPAAKPRPKSRSKKTSSPVDDGKKNKQDSTKITSIAPQLLELQLENAANGSYPWIVLITGSGCSGRGQTVNDLADWLDTRHVHTLAWDALGDPNRDRPWMHRYWHDLPKSGSGAFVFGGWYEELLRWVAAGHKGKLERALEAASRLEHMFVREGGVLLKVHLHLDRKAQKKRIENFLADPEQRWRVQPEDQDELKHAKEVQKHRDKLLDLTSWPEAPWHIVDASNEKARGEAVAMAVLDAFEAKKKQLANAPKPEKPLEVKSLGESAPRLASAPTHVVLAKDAYDKRLPELHHRLGELQRKKQMAERGLVAVFEGPDASGKGGAIRRVTRGLDARFYRVVPIAAPSELERAHPYLWRFWENVPPRGKMTFFDRSWYGRVLVERIEGFARKAEWERAYDEIVGFEQELVDAGYVVVKFWLHTSKDEQLKRFQARKDNAYKNYKITDDDLRNRKKWDAYQIAASDMIDRTSSKHAPWHVVAGDDKPHARITVLETLVETLERALK